MFRNAQFSLATNDDKEVYEQLYTNKLDNLDEMTSSEKTQTTEIDSRRNRQPEQNCNR